MKKLFTLAAAVLASFSLWAAEETFTFEWSAAGTKGFSYSQAGPSGGAMLADNAIYFVSNEGPKVDGSNLNPYRVGFIFKPAADVSLKIKGAAGSSDRTLQGIKIDKEADARLYNLCKDAVGSSATVMQYALENASDEDKDFYATVGILKKNKEVYSVAGDAKSVSGQTAQADLYAERVAANNIKFLKNSESEEMLTIGSPAEDFTFEAGKYYRIYTEVSSSTGAKLLSFTFVTAAPPCTAPTDALSLLADKTTDVSVGDIITFSTAGGNGSDIKLYDGETEISSPWTATVGAHSFTAVQEAKDGICGATTEAIEINVVSKDPVTSAVIEGPKEGIVGDKLTYTVEAEHATVFAWYVDGEKQAEASATFVYTAVLGDHAIYATASNEYTSEPVKSNEIALEVKEAGKVEGLLIKGTSQQEVSGPAAGSIVTNLSKGNEIKLDAEKYFGLALKDGFELQEGDVFIINITKAADMGKCMLYADKEGTELIFDEEVEYSKEAPSATGEKRITLPAAVAGKKAIFLFRGKKNEGPQWNPTFDYIAIERGGSATAIDNAQEAVKATKFIRNGQMFIEMNGVVYTLQGAVVK